MSENPEAPAVLSGTRRSIVDLLKRQGACDAQGLAEQLAISAMAVRQHLYALAEKGFVAYDEDARPVGRPAKLWRLTTGADAFFPDGHAALSVELLQSMRQAFGVEGLEKLVAVRAAAQRQSYGKRLAGAPDLAGRLEALARIRSEEGYMAEVATEGENFLLLENHCPICAAASECSGLCQAELEVFRSVLGPEVAVERIEHMPQGARRCAYRVSSV
ncbi:MAG: ArsR family transcriptional regulator [Alphaproteobacteria bacterium]|jgi:predicted ArsR family transcriptional regulator|nr:ArsR family transcriptional regulator [Alphaproteobacteria bacterium]